MRYHTTIIFLSVCVSCLSAQQSRLPIKEARGYAKACVEQIGNPYNGPLSTKVNTAKPCAVLGEGGGAMVIPVKGLDKKFLQQVGEKPVAIGQLWLRKWALVVAGKTVSRDNLNVVTLLIGDKNRPMPLLTLGVRKKNANLELVLFAEAGKPLQVLQLSPDSIIQELPLEIEWQRGKNQHDPLTLRILGTLQAELRITRTGS